MIPPPSLPELDLPAGWSTRVPDAEDVAELAELRARLLTAVRRPTGPDEEGVAAEVVGIGSWTRRQLVVLDPAGRIQAWAGVHDRAAGRTMPWVTVPPDAPDWLGPLLWPWCAEVAVQIAGARGLDQTQLDVMTDAGDERERRWLAEQGYRHTRTWLQMSRPVDPEERFPEPRSGVEVRRVARHEPTPEQPIALPVAGDLQIVHLMLEESFADHFNSYRESFPEFVQRLREDPGHRWDHWWIAEVDGVPGGALVGSVLGPDAAGAEGSYIAYIGVHRDARGRGVAKALLHTVLADARDRGHSRVGLEVDADSPTGADGLYLAMGWRTSYRTESWHRDVDVPEDLIGRPDRAPDEPDL